ncbi:hypothetical protein [Kocuria sp. NPDC057446]|uniref:hypothetical protein n=1 Tax=Kocuria sp. NPDC057446 TaxID=3346137 RepID=UPI00367B15BF
MSRSASVLVRIDRTGHTVTLIVTGKPTAGDQQEVARMGERVRELFPDTTVTVEFSSTPPPSTGDPQRENPHHRGDGEPERSSTPRSFPPSVGHTGS